MKRLSKTIIVVVVLAVVACCGILALAGILGGKSPAATQTAPAPTQSLPPITRAVVPVDQATTAPEPTEELAPTEQPTAEQSRCVPASEGQIARVRSGVKAIDQGNDVREVWAVKSNDFANVWFVAARIYGAGMESGTPEAGVWAINGDLDNPGVTMSVDGFAQQFSDWPDGSTTDAKTSMSDDGALQAQACAQK